MALVMDGFQWQCKLPSDIGAIDGSLIPQRKASKEQYGGVTNS
jgi:hypothetical protein